jgi:hypothetical protein
MELDKARHLFDLHHDHVEQIGRAQDMGHQHGLALQAAKMASQGLNPDGTPMLPPGASPPGDGGMGEGGGSADAAAGVAAGGDVAPPPVNSAPASFGQDMLGTMADGSAPAAVEEAPPAGKPPAEPAKKKKKPRRVSIKARDKDGRASDFEIHDDED